MGALPFLQIELTYSKPTDYRYSDTLQTLGDHLRKRRLDLQLHQKEVATKLGCVADSLVGWEKNRHFPEFHYLPKIISFLGYNPLPKPITIPEKIIHYRQVRGMSQAELAAEPRIDPSTLSRWENGTWSKSSKTEAAFKRMGIETL